MKLSLLNLVGLIAFVAPRDLSAQSIVASPNPIITNNGSLTGITTISASAPGHGSDTLGVYVNGTLFTQGGPGGSTVVETTGNWVGDGTVFILRDENTGQTLASVTVGVQTSAAGCGAIFASTGTAMAQVRPVGSTETFGLAGVHDASAVSFNVYGPDSSNFVQTYSSTPLSGTPNAYVVQISTTGYALGGYEIVPILSTTSGSVPCQSYGYFNLANSTALVPSGSAYFSGSFIETGTGEPTLTWNLTETGTNISGTMTAVNLCENTTYTWNVTGFEYEPGDAQLTATIVGTPGSTPSCSPGVQLRTGISATTQPATYQSFQGSVTTWYANQTRAC